VLAKVIVVYESKYGNTKLAAEKITEGISEVNEQKPFSTSLKKLTLTSFANMM